MAKYITYNYRKTCEDKHKGLIMIRLEYYMIKDDVQWIL